MVDFGRELDGAESIHCMEDSPYTDYAEFGGLTDVCIHYTAVDAHQHDYYIKDVTDAVAGSSKEAHEYALKAIKYLQKDSLITVADIESAGILC